MTFFFPKKGKTFWVYRVDIFISLRAVCFGFFYEKTNFLVKEIYFIIFKCLFIIF